MIVGSGVKRGGSALRGPTSTFLLRGSAGRGDEGRCAAAIFNDGRSRARQGGFRREAAIRRRVWIWINSRAETGFRLTIRRDIGVCRIVVNRGLLRPGGALCSTKDASGAVGMAIEGTTVPAGGGVSASREGWPRRSPRS